MSRSASSIDNTEYVLTLKAEDIEFEADRNPNGISRAFSESSEIPFMNDESMPMVADETAPFPSDQDQREDISVDEDHAMNNNDDADNNDNDGIDQVSDDENDDLDRQELVFLPNVDDDQSFEENFDDATQEQRAPQNTSLEDILSNEDLEKKNSTNQLEDLTDMLYEEVVDEVRENFDQHDQDINDQSAIEEAFKVLHHDDSAEEDQESSKRKKQVSAAKETDENKGKRQNFVITCVNDKVAEANRVYKTELARVQRKIKGIDSQGVNNDAVEQEKVVEHRSANNDFDESQEAVIEVEDEIRNDKTSSRDSSPSSPESSIEEGEEKPTPKEKKNLSSSPAMRNKRKRSRSKSAEKSSHKTKVSKKKSSTDKKRAKDISPFQAFFEDTRYFLIKSANPENVILSKVKGVWSTTPRNERLLNRAFKRHHNVILIFSVEKSQAYQGFCRMCTESSHNGSPINWVLPPGMNSRVLGGSFKVCWLNRNELPFGKVQHLYNPWNDNKPIKIARDGTEFEPNIGKQLCCSFTSDPATDIGALLKECKIPTGSPKHRVSRPLTPPRGILPGAVKRDRPSGVVGSGTTPISGRYHVYPQAAPPRTRGAPYRPPPPPPPPPPTTGRNVVTSRKYVLDKSSASRTTSYDDRSRKRPALSSSSRSGYDDLLINGSYSDYIRHYSSSYGGAGSAQFSSSTVPASYAAYPTSTVAPYENSYYPGYYGAGTQHNLPSSAVHYSSPRKEPTTYRRRASPSHRGTGSNTAPWPKDCHYRKSPSPVRHRQQRYNGSAAAAYIPSSSRRRSPAAYPGKYTARR